MTTDEVTKYIFLEDSDVRGDIAFVFGTWNSWKISILKVALLYKKGLVPKILVSGGMNPVTCPHDVRLITRKHCVSHTHYGKDQEVLSNGVNRHSGIVEGDLMGKEMENLGIPPADILIENKATNTLENVTFSLPIIDRALGLDSIKVITAVVKNFHARRALMTLRKQMPEGTILKSAVYISPIRNFTKDNWHESELGRRTVMEEVRKIQEYLKNGSIAEL